MSARNFHKYLAVTPLFTACGEDKEEEEEKVNLNNLILLKVVALGVCVYGIKQFFWFQNPYRV